jgi:hypothetical protein
MRRSYSNVDNYNVPSDELENMIDEDEATCREFGEKADYVITAGEILALRKTVLAYRRLSNEK